PCELLPGQPVFWRRARVLQAGLVEQCLVVIEELSRVRDGKRPEITVERARFDRCIIQGTDHLAELVGGWFGGAAGRRGGGARTGVGGSGPGWRGSAWW